MTIRVAQAVVAAMSWAMVANVPANADTVHRRGSDAAVQGRITMIDEAGVSVTADSGTSTIVSWDRVRSVDMGLADPKLDRFLPMATELWRARSRIERRDYALAEPILAQYFDKYRGQSNETALVIAEGLLRCRLARQANDQAVIPALETARILRAKKATVSYRSLPPVIDERTSLCMMLPPAWANTAGLANLQRDLANYREKEDAVIAGLAALYRRAVQQTLNSSSGSDTLITSDDHPGVELLKLLVDAGSSDERARGAARDRLSQNLAGHPPWTEAWARFAIGQSMLREAGNGRQQAGLVSMIHIPARFGAEQPYLAGLALATISDWLDASGNAESAAALRAELQRTYPIHPALAATRPRQPSPPSSTQPSSTKSAS